MHKYKMNMRRRKVNRSPLPKYELSRAASMKNKLIESIGDYYKGSLMITRFRCKRDSRIYTPEENKVPIKKRQEVLVIDQVRKLHNNTPKNFNNASFDKLDDAELKKIKEINKRRCKSSTLKTRHLNSRCAKRESLEESRTHTMNVIPMSTQVEFLGDFFNLKKEKPKISEVRKHSQHKPLKGKKSKLRFVNLPVGIHFIAGNEGAQKKFKNKPKNRCEILFTRGRIGRNNNFVKVPKKNYKNLTSEIIKAPLMNIVRPTTANAERKDKLKWDRVNSFNIIQMSRNNRTNTSNEDTIEREEILKDNLASSKDYIYNICKSSFFCTQNSFFNELKKPSELFKYNSKSNNKSSNTKLPPKKVYMNERLFQINKTYCM